MLKFITGNKGKVKEMTEILAPIKIRAVNIDLEEIQELDVYKIIRHKLKEAFKHHKRDFFVEDTSAYYQAFNKMLPGPFMKWFLYALEPKGLYELAKKLGDFGAEMRTIIAYAKSPKQIYFFEGKVKGRIVKPRGKHGFGVDPIFMPQGSSKTLAELKGEGTEIYSKFSARGRGANKFKKFLLYSIAKLI